MGMILLPMIVLEIEIGHVFAVYTKRQPKVSRHPDAPLSTPTALQPVQFPSRKLRHLLDAPGLLDRMEDYPQLRHKVGANAAAITRFIEAL
jgi:hypothetical protein